MTIKFLEGKYEGKNVEDIMISDKSYCNALINTKRYIGKQVLALIKTEFNGHDYYMSFGPFKNKKLEEINDMEPEYIEYLKKDKYIQTKCPLLIKKINELVE